MSATDNEFAWRFLPASDDSVDDIYEMLVDGKATIWGVQYSDYGYTPYRHALNSAGRIDGIQFLTIDLDTLREAKEVIMSDLKAYGTIEFLHPEDRHDHP